MAAQKPKILNVIEPVLEERAPPNEDDYEFVESWPEKETPKPEETEK